jgi:Ca2+-binding EF-hand superfamily protein
LLQKDVNRDREVNIDGFKASVIAAGIVDAKLLTLSDLEEIFNLISVNGMLRYGEYMVEQERRTLQYFPKESQQKIEESIGLAESSRTLDASVQQMTAPVEPTAKSKTIAAPTSAHILRTAKEKIERFLASQDVTLSMLFAVIDTNSDDPLSRPEFSRRLSAVQAGLEAEEVDALFTHLDSDKDGNISQREFMQAFSGANADQIVSRMRRVLFGASMSVKQLLSTHCGSGPISRLEFRKIVRALIDKLADFEIDSVFKELSGGAETLAREDFLDRFGRDEQEKQFQTGIEDILKPLGTFMRRKQMSVFTLFQEHDQDRNQMLSAKELATALRTTLKYELSPDEVNTMSEYFRARFERAEVNKAQFGDLLSTTWVRKWESKRARAALAAIRAKLKEQGRQIEAVLATEARLTMDQVPLRAFKRAIYQLGAVTQQQVNNLATYLDRYDDGMIRIGDVKLALTSDRFDPKNSSVKNSSVARRV